MGLTDNDLKIKKIWNIMKWAVKRCGLFRDFLYNFTEEINFAFLIFRVLNININAI